ncbi:hypothetical protein CIB48_g9974 [Xylaria polymorpha]|nr:hypothetical protein CIB48_g9974 [Xylaria polymorpha]
MPAGVEELEDAICNIIQILKQIPELGGAQLKVSGGLALWHHLGQYRKIDGIEFIVTLPTSVEFMVAKLLDHPLSPFIQENQVLFYQSPEGHRTRIKIQEELFWYQVDLPLLHHIGYGVVPYISRSELDRLYPDQSRPGASDVTKRQCNSKDTPPLKSRHTGGASPRKCSVNNNMKEFSLLSSIAENGMNDRSFAKHHRRACSDPGIYALRDEI